MAYLTLPPVPPATDDALLSEQVKPPAEVTTHRDPEAVRLAHSGTVLAPTPPETSTLEFSTASEAQASQRPLAIATTTLLTPLTSTVTPRAAAIEVTQPSLPSATPGELPQPSLPPSSPPILSPTPPTTPNPSPTPNPSLTPPEEPATPADATPIAVNKINVTGSTILTPKDLAPIVQPLEGRSVTLADLQSVADKITQVYLDRGYITSRATLSQQTIQDGVVQIQVIEGSLERIDVEGTQRLNPNYIRSRVKLGAGTPLNTATLEDQLRLLRADPLFKNVEASLRAGTKLGQSILIVRVTEAPSFEGNASADNYSPPSVGSEEFGLSLGYRNLTGIGDQILGSYSISNTGGASNLGLAYRVPVNPMNGTIQLRANWNANKITQDPFNVLNIRGNTQLYEINYRQPIVRSPREEFALSLGFTYQNGQTFTFNDLPTPFGVGPDANGVSRTSVIRFGQDYVRRDAAGAWSLRSQFNLGTGLFNATHNPGSDIPDGQFFSWLGQVQRVQRLSDNNLLILQADLQLTPDSLLPSQQFVIGGGQSVRGYRQNVRSGDNGFRISLEDRITVKRDANGSPVLQVAPFSDIGQVWNVSGNPNTLPSQNFLATIGLGLLWQPLPSLSVRLDYGVPLITLKDKGNNAQDQGFYFSVNYQF